MGGDRSELVLQVVDWTATDAYDADTSREDYMVKLFGVTEDGRSASVNVTKYTPSFYITFTNPLLREIAPRTAETLQNLIVSKLPARLKPDLPYFSEDRALTALEKEQLRTAKENIVRTSICDRKSMVGFSADETRRYLRLIFRNAEVARYVRYNVFMRRIRGQEESKLIPSVITLTGISTKVVTYETNIDPLLRFLHYRKIQPSGWVRVENFEEENSVVPSTNEINVTACMWDVHPHDTPKIAPLVVMSFDLECTSSHGDFPVARKNYGKPANEMVDLYRRYREEHLNKYKCKSAFLDAVCGMFLIGKNRDLSRVYPKRKIEDKEGLESLIRTEIGEELINILQEGPRLNEQLETETPAIRLTRRMDSCFPPLKGDRIIQIGTAVHRYGDTACSYKAVLTLDSCDPIEGVDVRCCETEKELIKRWCELLHEINPDVIIGYNILGFDFDYLYTRAQELGCRAALEEGGRLVGVPSVFKEQKLASSALGDNTFKYMEWKGRVIIDVMKVVQRDHKLDSYKLDHVASVFITGQVRAVETPRVLLLNRTRELHEGDFLQMGAQKARIVEISGDRVTLAEPVQGTPKKWGLVKDDVHPKQIFECQKGTSADRRVIAKYCVQDCVLCNLLLIKLEMLANNIGMSNVCCVPLSYIFMRGQGIKIFSLVSKQCKEDQIVVPVLNHNEEEEDDGYEGAIVLDPTPGIYTEPVSVMDYASLYPSSMISENISHDSLVLDKLYDNLPGYEYVDITYDVYHGKGEEKRKVGEKTCRYAQFPENKKGILPRILMKLLAQRKLTRKKMLYETVRTKDGRLLIGLVKELPGGCVRVADAEGGPAVTLKSEEIEERCDTYDEFAKAVLDGLQLAYKVTANSLYGQVGARTSPIYRKELAASTTATGRDLILRAKEFMETHYDARTIYGDTDSVFVDFRIKERYGLQGVEALRKSIEIAMEASSAFKLQLKAPHDLEYEKTFWPFVILSKKRYIGNLYEHDVDNFKQKGMGIVLKRRDNANILKRVYGGIIDIILQHRELSVALEFLRSSLQELVAGNYPLEDLVITKTLRGTYADPTRIAHKVLADRMFRRDPGSAPQVNDRIPYVYVEHDRKDKSLLQGDKIEHPSYIRENNIRPDYTFYISNQLQNPISQLLSLSLEKIPGYRRGENYYQNMTRKLKREGMTEKKVQKRIAHLREVETKSLLFVPTLTDLELKRKGIRKITEFFI